MAFANRIPSYRRQFELLTCIAVFALGWMLFGSVRVASAAPSCDFSEVVSAEVRLIDTQGSEAYTVLIDDPMRKAFAYLDGFDLWQDGPDGAYGDFMTPRDIQTVAWITLTTEQGENRWLWFAESPSTPGRAYAWVFTSLESTTDSHGEHYGAHQMCATVDVPLESVQALMVAPGDTSDLVAVSAPRSG